MKPSPGQGRKACFPGLPARAMSVADAGRALFFPAACPLPYHKKSPEFRPQGGGFIENGAVEFWARTHDPALRTQAQVKPKGLASGSSLPSPLNFPVLLFLASEISHPYPPASSRSRDSQLPVGSQEQSVPGLHLVMAGTGPFSAPHFSASRGGDKMRQ